MRKLNKKVAEELRSLAKANEGQLLPKVVVEYARRHKRSALYRHFEWDDSRAAEQWRIEQARKLIALVVTVIGNHQTREFVSLTVDRGRDGPYRDIRGVLSSADLLKILLHDALEELENFRRKYHILRELEPIWKAMRRLRKPGRGKSPSG